MEKPAIVILHGWNLSASRFENLVKEFENSGHKVFCFDLPGFGNSLIPERAFFLSDYVDFVLESLKKHKIIKPVIIGHSFGGRVGILLTAKKPQLIKALVLTGTPGINPVPKAKIKFFLILARMGNFFFSIPPFIFFSDLARKLLYRLAHAHDFYNTNPNLRSTFKNVVREDLRVYLSQISVPTLLLWGEDDRIVPVEVAVKMSKLIKNVSLVIIQDSRHGLPWVKPNEFVSEVEKFLEKLKQ